MKNVAVKKGRQDVASREIWFPNPVKWILVVKKAETNGVVREDLTPQLKKSPIHQVKIATQKDPYLNFWVSLGMKRKDTVYVPLDLKSLKETKSLGFIPFLDCMYLKTGKIGKGSALS